MKTYIYPETQIHHMLLQGVILGTSKLGGNTDNSEDLGEFVDP